MWTCTRTQLSFTRTFQTLLWWQGLHHRAHLQSKFFKESGLHPTCILSSLLSKRKKKMERFFHASINIFSCYLPVSFSLISLFRPPSLHSRKVTRRDRLFRSCIKGTNYPNMQPTSILSIRLLSTNLTILQNFPCSPSTSYPAAIILFFQQWLTFVLFLFPPSPSAFPQRTASFPPTFPSSF